MARGTTYAITNATKVAGLFVGVRAATETAHPDAVTLAFAAFMMAGAQLSETAIVTLIERFFGVDRDKGKP